MRELRPAWAGVSAKASWVMELGINQHKRVFAWGHVLSHWLVSGMHSEEYDWMKGIGQHINERLKMT